MKHRLIKAIEFIARRLNVWKFLYLAAGVFMRKKILAVFTFHRVTSPENSQKYFLGYDRGQDTESFELQIEAIRKYFRVIDLDEFLDIVEGRKVPVSHSALLTFDDADSDFTEYAYPILRKHNCPSVNFAPTGYIETDRRFWHLRGSNIFYNMNAESWDKFKKKLSDLPDELRSIIEKSSVNSAGEKVETCRRVLIFLRGRDIEDRERLITALEAAANYDYTLGIQCMSWDELEVMERNGVMIESHTNTHPELARVDGERIKSELLESQQMLQDKLGKRVRTVCYPAGSFNEKVLEVMAGTDYTAGFSSLHNTCRYPLEGDDMYRIPRFGMHGESEDDIHGYLGKVIVKRLLKGQ